MRTFIINGESRRTPFFVTISVPAEALSFVVRETTPYLGRQFSFSQRDRHRFEFHENHRDLPL